jgi:hypothetical protein
MRKILVLILLHTSLVSIAQQKKDFFISLNGILFKDEVPILGNWMLQMRDVDQYAINLETGYMINNKWMLGIEGIVQRGSKVYPPFFDENQELKISYNGAGIFAKRFFKISNHFFVTAKADFIYKVGDSEYRTSAPNGYTLNRIETEIKSVNVNLSPALVYSVNNKCLVELGYGIATFTRTKYNAPFYNSYFNYMSGRSEREVIFKFNPLYVRLGFGILL